MPQELALPGGVAPGYELMPEGMDDWMDHGTRVASIAGGKECSVAPNANLFLAKKGANFRKKGTDRVYSGGSPGSEHHLLGTVLTHIKGNSRGKAVVNISWSKLLPWETRHPKFLHLIPE